MKDVPRYLVTWGPDGIYMEPFSLWRDASLWFDTVQQEADSEAKILYWHQGEGCYKEAVMPPAMINIERLALYRKIGRLA